MALVHIDGNDLVVVIEGLDKLWAFKSSLTIPLANVRGATADPGIAADPKGIRAPGAHLPGPEGSSGHAVRRRPRGRLRARRM